MKKLFLTVCLFATLSLPARVINLGGSTTRAVVIGISDYQDEQISDLRFADRDAEAFANFLHSLPIMLFTVVPFHRLIIQKSYKPDYLFNFNIALIATCTILRIKYHEP
ncbi:MAG: hypothetical protein IPN76_25450 [Saprospiraceae bacterium]|nr:hypothetical protein [Saprospiraceae bacterium]